MVRHLIRILLSCLLLAYLAFQVDLPLIRTAFTRIHVGWYLLSTLFALAGALFMSGKYRLLIRKTTLSQPFRRLLAIQFISRFYALFLPTALGPEAVRWYKITRNRSGKPFFLAATVYERILFLLVLTCFSVVPLFLIPLPAPVVSLRTRLLPPALGLAAILLSGLGYLLWPPFQHQVRRLIAGITRLRTDSRVNFFLADLELKDRSPGLLACLLLLTIGWQLFFLIRIYFLFCSLGLPFTLLEAAWMGSLVLFLQVLPISFAGLGVREGAYAYLFPFYGASAEQGLLMGVLFFFQMLIFAIIGAIFNLLERETGDSQKNIETRPKGK
ncbi:MAG: YbhN family protein [Desulfosudaceae bacterium]